MFLTVCPYAQRKKFAVLGDLLQTIWVLNKTVLCAADLPVEQR